MRKKVLAAFQANATTQIVNIAVQLLGFPIFLRFWGPEIEMYGEWLMLSTIPAYLSLADFGFASVAANDMSMHRARNDLAQVNTVFQHVLRRLSSGRSDSFASPVFALLGSGAIRRMAGVAHFNGLTPIGRT
jgi:O-antigen/teichoic acid export membrane protein